MKATSFQINRNLGLKSGRKSPDLSGYANASGAAPTEFKLDYYNALITDPRLTPSQIKDTIDEVQYYVTEYQRQTNEHTGNNDSYNAGISASWRDTAQMVLNELTAKLAGSNNNGSGSGTPVPPPANTPGADIAATSGFNWTPVFWIGGFLAVGTIATILIRRSMKNGKNKPAVAATT